MDDINTILTLLKSNKKIYPPINKVVIARNLNANNTKRLLWDFLDIYVGVNDTNISSSQNLIKINIDNQDFLVDFSSSGIFEKVPDNINNTNGENIEAFSQVIQTLCNNVPINLDVRGIFSGITNQSSSIQEKILCKMRLAAAILDINGDNNTLFQKPLDLSNYKFNITSKSATSPQEQPKIVFWGNGTCKSNDKKLYTSEFNFKITQFSSTQSSSTSTSTSTYIYIVSVSSSIVGPFITLLPLPDYFIKNIDSTKNVNNYLLSPDHCIGFSRNGTYNVKFVITQGQYDEVFSTKSSNSGVVFQFLCPKNPFNASADIDNSNPFPDVLWMASNNIGSLSVTSTPAPAPPPPPPPGPPPPGPPPAPAPAPAPAPVAQPKWEIQCIETTPGSNTTYPKFVDKTSGIIQDAKPEGVSFKELIDAAKKKYNIPDQVGLGMEHGKLIFVDEADKYIDTCSGVLNPQAAAPAAPAPPAPAPPAPAPYIPRTIFTDTSNTDERARLQQEFKEAQKAQSAQQNQQPIEEPSVFKQASIIANKLERQKAIKEKEELLAKITAEEEAKAKADAEAKAKADAEAADLAKKLSPIWLCTNDPTKNKMTYSEAAIVCAQVDKEINDKKIAEEKAIAMQLKRDLVNGSPCTKLNARKIAGGKVFTCKKISKKLVWR